MESKTVGWKVNWKKPASLDYVNPEHGYRGDSLTGSAYWVPLDELRSKEGLNDWIKHLSIKVWFNQTDFLTTLDEALKTQ